MKTLLTLDELKNSINIIAGSLALALGVVLFFLSNSITTGGTPGIALLLHHLSGLSIGTLIILVNIPLLILGIKYIGKLFAFRTIVSIILLSIFVDLFSIYLKIESITSNNLLASVFGGIFIGIGVGMILRGDSSVGGSTIIARIVSSQTEIKPGQVILFIDFLIIIGSIYVFRDVDKALLSIISIYITSKCIDKMLSGVPTTKVVHISTIHANTLCSVITEQLGHQGTIITGTGLSHEKEKEIIFIIVELKKLRTLRDIIKKYDPDALMIVMEATEMLGRGY